MYAIKRTSSAGGYAAKSDCRESYTHDPKFVRVFKTRERAEAVRCLSDETVVFFDDPDEK